MGANCLLFISETHKPYILQAGLGCGNHTQLPHNQSSCSAPTGQSITLVLTHTSLATRLQPAQWVYTYKNPLYKFRPPLG